MKKETFYASIEKISYLGKQSPGTFEAGFVKSSKHKANTIYLQIPPDSLFELTDDEAMAIIGVLSYTLWRRNVPMSWKKRGKLKWIKKSTTLLQAGK